MSNPVSPFRNNLFASRGCDIQSALDYAEIMFNTLSSTDQVAVRTAFGVLINTIENAVTQSQGPSPEKLAIIDLIDERIAKHNFIREESIGDVVDAHIDNLDDKIADWMSNNFDLDNYDVDSSIEAWMTLNLRDKVMAIVEDDDISDQISRWMSDNFDVEDYNVGDAIESWADRNLEEKINEAINNLTFTVNVE